MTSQAPHAIRTVFALVTGLPEQNIRIISPDLGGGFGNKVPVYPGYVVATAASLLLGRPVKWIEDRNENLISTGFARDYHMTGDLAVDEKGKMLALRVHLDSDNGAFFADAQPSSSRRACSTSSPALTTSRPRMSPLTATTPTKRQAESPIAARSGSQRRATSSSGWSPMRPSSSGSTRPSFAS